jgi:hypothetical protein
MQWTSNQHVNEFEFSKYCKSNQSTFKLVEISPTTKPYVSQSLIWWETFSSAFWDCRNNINHPWRFKADKLTGPRSVILKSNLLTRIDTLEQESRPYDSPSRHQNFGIHKGLIYHYSPSSKLRTSGSDETKTGIMKSQDTKVGVLSCSPIGSTRKHYGWERTRELLRRTDQEDLVELYVFVLIW